MSGPRKLRGFLRVLVYDRGQVALLALALACLFLAFRA